MLVTYTKAAIAGGMFWIATGVSPAAAQSMTAGVVAERMSPTDFFTYTTGIIEGLAIARLQADNNQPEGMGCVYDWFYDDPQTRVDQLLVAFARFPDYPPAAVVSVMVQRECD